MDDSVIKVLRRNGSWDKLDKKESSKTNVKSTKDEFSIDKNFGVLAEEIKKRMKMRSLSNKDNNNYIPVNNDVELSKNYNESIKIKILPYLKSIERLTSHREDLLKNVGQIDRELEIVKTEMAKRPINFFFLNFVVIIFEN